SRLAEMFTRDTLTFNANANFQLTGTSLPYYEDYRDQNNVFSGLSTVTFPIPLNWGGQAEPQQLNASLVSGNFFDVLGVKPYRGRTFIADGDKKIGGNPEVVLSYSLWARRFGSDEKFIRSEERRVGKECRARWWWETYKKKDEENSVSVCGV